MVTSLPSTRRWMWPSLPWMWVVVWLTILAPVSSRRTSGRLWGTGWPLRGVSVVGGGGGRVARAGGGGVRAARPGRPAVAAGAGGWAQGDDGEQDGGTGPPDSGK